jgi:ribose transport system ATP-binding protein
VGLALRRGEILGLYGLVGAGRSELAKAVIGALPVTAGTIRVRGREARIGSPREALRRWGIGYVSEDRKGEGLILAHSLRRNVAVTVWRRLAGALGLLTEGAERRVVAPLVERLGIRAASQRVAVGTLSGGNQQKASVAKWLAAGVDVLIVDEPTVGVDVRTKAYLHGLLRDLAEGGTAILLISSDMPEMVALADRILVMRQGRITGEVAGGREYAAASHAIMDLIHAEPAAAA